MDLTFTPMTESDIPTFNRIRNESIEFLHDPTAYTVEQSLEWFRIEKPEYYMLVLDGEFIGYFRTSNRTPDSIFIGLDIEAKHRGKGLAIPAYKMFMQHLYDTGIKKFYLRVFKFNERAIHIYKKLGFEVVSTAYVQNRDAVDVLMMYDTKLSDFRLIYQSFTFEERDSFRNASILVTGCNGFMGVWICKFIEYLNTTHDYNIRLYAIDIHRNIRPVIGEHEWLDYISMNIVDNEYLNNYFSDIEIDYIFNCAGIAVPSEYMRKPIDTLDVSYIGTRNILEFARRERVKSVVCFSSSEVYGSPEPDSIPTPESHIGRIHTHSNRSCYDVGKLVLETLCYTYYNEYKVPVKVIRPFNLYGPYMEDSRVVPNFIRRIMEDEDLSIYGTGEQTRTFCYMADAMVMILKIAVFGENSGIYNVGNPTPEVSMPMLVESFSSALGKNIKYNLIPYPKDYPNNEPIRRCPDISKAVLLCGYTPQIGLIQGLKRTYEYFTNTHI